MPSTEALSNISSGAGNSLMVHLNLLQHAANENDRRLITRVLHYLPQTRRKLTAPLLSGLLSPLANSSALAATVISHEEGIVSFEKVPNLTGAAEVYIYLLAGIFLLEKGHIKEAAGVLAEACKLGESLGARYLDPLLARVYFFLGRAFEELGQLGEMYNQLMIAHRQSALHHYSETQAVVYNQLLRILVMNNEFDAAHKFAEKSPFPGSSSGANQARYHYYLARIQAMQANYVESKENLVLALRKTPHVQAAIGFSQAVSKLMVLVQLLLGEIPDRQFFSQKQLAKSLAPYLKLTQSVRLGDLSLFQQVLAEEQHRLTGDRTLSLVQRLRSNVLRAGLKRLNRAYSHISLADIAQKLILPSVEDAEFVLLKAIREGVVDGEIDHDAGTFRSRQTCLPYYTDEPQSSLNTRILELNALRDGCVRAMQYPQGTNVKSSVPDKDSLPTEAELMEEYMDADDDLGL